MLQVNIFGQCNDSFNPGGLKILTYLAELKKEESNINFVQCVRETKLTPRDNRPALSFSNLQSLTKCFYSGLPNKPNFQIKVQQGKMFQK